MSGITLRCSGCGEPLVLQVTDALLLTLTGASCFAVCASCVPGMVGTVAPPPTGQTGLGRSGEASEQSDGANAYQHGGSHYKGVAYQHWDFVLDTQQSPLQSCGTKYLTRGRKHADGPKLQFEKCLHYIHKVKEAEGEGRHANVAHVEGAQLLHFMDSNKLTALEGAAIFSIIEGNWDRATAQVQTLLSELDQPADQASR